LNRATATLLERAGGDPYLGRKLSCWIEDAGFIATGSDVRNVPADDAAVRINLDALAPTAVAAGLVTAAEVEAVAARPLPRFRYGPRFVAAWGMKAKNAGETTPSST
jgi:hypothetical protein